MSDFDRMMTRGQAIQFAARRAKKNPGKSYVVYFDHRDETCKEFYDVCTYQHYLEPYAAIREQNVVMILSWDDEAKEFEYE